MRILVVEDDLIVGRLLKDFIYDQGFSAEFVGRWTDGAKLILSKAYDIIVLDLTLPDGDGVDLLELARLKQPETPVTVITARQDFAFGELFDPYPNLAAVFRKTSRIEDACGFIVHEARKRRKLWGDGGATTPRPRLVDGANGLGRT
ncbi:MAG: response regulator [Pseudomonadota bacterium]|nr:response regulator [Pseudomonadota bacterium]